MGCVALEAGLSCRVLSTMLPRPRITGAELLDRITWFNGVSTFDRALKFSLLYGSGGATVDAFGRATLSAVSNPVF
jgi:hypothetical protein